MIEREFIAQKTKEFYIKSYIESKMHNVGISQIRIKKIPLGEKIIISSSRPSLIVGSKGSNIRELTKVLKTKFKLENPQIEINEVKDIFLDAHIVAEKIASSLERFGSAQFKGTGHKIMANVLRSGALGIEVIISGKIPGARAKSWRFYQGYLKKCGDISISGVRHAQTVALLKSGIIGIKVAIMPADLELPDKIEILKEPMQIAEVVGGEKEESVKGKKKSPAKKKAAKKKSSTKKKEEKVVEESAEESESAEKSVVEESAEKSSKDNTEASENPEKPEDENHEIKSQDDEGEEKN